MHTCTVSTAAVAILDSPSEKQKSFDYYAVKINLIFCLSHIKVIITDLLDVSNKCLDSKPLTLFGFITIVVGSGCDEDTFFGVWWLLVFGDIPLLLVVSNCLVFGHFCSCSNGSPGYTCQDSSTEEAGVEGDNAVFGPVENAIQAVHEAG